MGLAVPLTWELDIPESPINQFLDRHFPLTRRPGRGHRAPELAFTDLLALSGANKKSTIDSNVASTKRGYVGMAVDYRIRYFFEVTSSVNLKAAEGAKALRSSVLLAQAGFLDAEPDLPDGAFAVVPLIDDFFHSLDETVERISPVKRALGWPDEQMLARYSLLLGFFEQLYRDPRGPNCESPLYMLKDLQFG